MNTLALYRCALSTPSTPSTPEINWRSACEDGGGPGAIHPTPPVISTSSPCGRTVSTVCGMVHGLSWTPHAVDVLSGRDHALI